MKNVVFVHLYFSLQYARMIDSKRKLGFEAANNEKNIEFLMAPVPIRFFPISLIIRVWRFRIWRHFLAPIRRQMRDFAVFVKLL